MKTKNSHALNTSDYVAFNDRMNNDLVTEEDTERIGDDLI
jgi:hypothetical protein